MWLLLPLVHYLTAISTRATTRYQTEMENGIRNPILRSEEMRNPGFPGDLTRRLAAWLASWRLLLPHCVLHLCVCVVQEMVRPSSSSSFVVINKIWNPFARAATLGETNGFCCVVIIQCTGSRRSSSSTSSIITDFSRTGQSTWDVQENGVEFLNSLSLNFRH